MAQDFNGLIFTSPADVSEFVTAYNRSARNRQGDILFKDQWLEFDKAVNVILILQKEEYLHPKGYFDYFKVFWNQPVQFN